jgi:hypothetical protein
VVVSQQSAIVLEEIEEARHLLEVRRYIGVVASKMHIVELKFNDVLDAGCQMTLIVRCRRGCDWRRR